MLNEDSTTLLPQSGGVEQNSRLVCTIPEDLQL